MIWLGLVGLVLVVIAVASKLSAQSAQDEFDCSIDWAMGAMYELYNRDTYIKDTLADPTKKHVKVKVKQIKSAKETTNGRN